MNHKKFTDSTTMREAWYYPEDRELKVMYVTGKKYSYAGVPKEVWEGLINAISPGVFMSNRIKGNYPYKLISQ